MRVCKMCNKEYERSESGAGYKYCSQNCSDEARRIRNRERWREANPGWGEGTNKVCEWCGQAYTVPARNASQSRFCSEECKQTCYSREVRWHGSLEEYIKERTKQKEERQIKLEEERKQKLRTVECAECGQPFETMQPNQLTCSTECSRTRKNRLRRTRQDKRINSDNTIDKDISLKLLFKRDEGTCYICGDKCDFGDKETESGHFISGPKYPSIDHIVPISRGGKHAWDNVKLAHHRCNSIKSDTLPSQLGLNISIEDAYALAKVVKTQKKRVKQYSRDGKLLAVHESTAEAGRQTGLKSKGIQKCARGESLTHGGFLWSY